MASSSSLSPENEEIGTPGKFKVLASKSFELFPFSVSVGSVTLCYFMTTQSSSELYSLVHQQYKCLRCAINARHASVYIGVDGPIFSEKFCDEHKLEEYQSKNPNKNWGGSSGLYRKIRDEMKKPREIIGIYLVPHDNNSLIEGPRVSGYNEKKSSYYFHYHWISSETSNIQNDEQYAWFKTIIEVFCPNYKKFICERYLNDPEGSIKSLEIFLQTCDRVEYANKLARATTWMIGIIREYMATYSTTPYESLDQIEQWKIAMDILIHKSYFEKGTENRPTCATYHKITKNVSSILENSNDLNQLVKILRDRMSPTNYKRKTTIPTYKLRNDFWNLLGITGFTSTILTIKQLKTIVPDAVHEIKQIDHPVVDVGSSSGIPNRISSFHERALSTNKITVYELIDMIERDGGELMIDCSNLNIIQMVDYGDFPQKYLRVPVGWCFLNGQKLGISWCKVNAIVDISKISNYHKNIMFLLPVKCELTGYCCFPEYLTPDIWKKYGVVFEEYGKTKKCVVPDGSYGPFAYGVGVSSGKDTGELVIGINVKLNGKQYTITHLGTESKKSIEKISPENEL